jgi:hypothetical protein
MEKQPRNSLPQASQTYQMPTDRRDPWRWIGAGLIGLGMVVAGYLLLRSTTQNGHAQDFDDKDKAGPPLFVGWSKPDLAIIISGQMQGYLQPCGCSDPQKGGLTRRYNFMQSLKDKGWPVAAVDLGDIAQPSGPQQRLKYVYSMKALKVMGYQAIGIGKNEFLMPLTEALGHYSANFPQPRLVAANLAETTKGGLFHALNVRQGEIFTVGTMKLGATGAIGQVTAKEIEKSLPPTEKDIRILDKDTALPATLKILTDSKVDLGILLYQGHENEAKDCAKVLHEAHLKSRAIAPVRILVCLTNEEEPPSLPTKDASAPNTSIITIGHKGRYVGVVGVWKTAKGMDLKYQLVAMGPEQATKPGKTNPVMDLMEKYAQDVREGNYLARFPRDNHEVQVALKDARYVGTAVCAGCHDDANKVWEKTRHTHAYDTLVKAKDPKLRQFDGECIACHTVGFKHHTGYYDPPPGSTPKQVEKHNLKLLDVGCESCHGPGSAHANNPNNKDLYSLINLYRPSDKELDPKTPAILRSDLHKKRMSRIDGMLCQKCHDVENDVHWSNFQQKWDQIAHPTLKKGVNAAQAK